MSIIEIPDAAAVALPRDADEVAAAVRDARANGLRVAPQGTGHNAGPLGDLSGTLLLRTSRMRGVKIDAPARRARVAAGAVWGDLIGPASALGLACLHGSSPAVGIVGDCLGGGLGWYARKYGLASNHVTAIDVVTADGALVRATPDDDPSLFWALRGGGGSFGVVCSLELCLYPVRELYAGTLSFDPARAGEALRAWHALLPGLPDELTSAARVTAAGVTVTAAYLGTARGGEALLAPLRALGPRADTLAMVAPAALADLGAGHRAGDHRLVSRLPAPALDALVSAAGPATTVELRHTGGALARSLEHHGALDTLAGELCVTAAGPGAAEAMRALDAHDAGRRYLNLASTPCDVAAAFGAEAWQLLTAVKCALDPEDRFHANHPVPTH